MLQTRNTWEVSGSKVMAALFGQTGIQHLRCVEVGLNSQLFHVDVVRVNDPQRKWSRYILGSFSDAAEFLAMQGEFLVRLSLQTKLREDQNYETHPIKEVLAISAKGGISGHFFVGVDGRRHSDSYWDPVLTRSITSTKSIWVDSEA